MGSLPGFKLPVPFLYEGAPPPLCVETGQLLGIFPEETAAFKASIHPVGMPAFVSFPVGYFFVHSDKG
jgi:hypothetical protein